MVSSDFPLYGEYGDNIWTQPTTFLSKAVTCNTLLKAMTCGTTDAKIRCLGFDVYIRISTMLNYYIRRPFIRLASTTSGSLYAQSVSAHE